MRADSLASSPVGASKGCLERLRATTGMRILVVEDEVKVSSFLRKGLEQSGYEVEVAGDGEEGYRKFRESSFGLVLLDLMLPVKSGWDLIPLLRQVAPSVPIVAVTAKGSVEDRVHGLNLGCDDYLVKPFSFAELLARIRAQFRRGAAAAADELRAADLVLDPLKRKVTRAGKPIELTNKEYALLEYLMRNKDQIVTRGMIIQNIWDASFEKLTNVVDVYINYVRNKVDRGFEPRLIQTVRGVGYILRGSQDP
jgi:DNA-binding response OmpR family regulator